MKLPDPLTLQPGKTLSEYLGVFFNTFKDPIIAIQGLFIFAAFLIDKT
jgi:hypothetical protein